MSEYNFSIKALDVNKTFNKKNSTVEALTNFCINLVTLEKLCTKL